VLPSVFFFFFQLRATTCPTSSLPEAAMDVSVAWN
jgi:hypothetical protein